MRLNSYEKKYKFMEGAELRHNVISQSLSARIYSRKLSTPQYDTYYIIFPLALNALFIQCLLAPIKTHWVLSFEKSLSSSFFKKANKHFLPSEKSLLAKLFWQKMMDLKLCLFFE